MTDQLQLGDDAPPRTGPVKYTLHQHMRTKRYFAIEWADGDPTGLAGPYTTPIAQADLATAPYSRNVSVIKALRQDIARRDTYAQWEYDA